MIDYKKIFRNQNLRFHLLKYLSFIPDKFMVSLQYYIKLGRRINWNNPKRFTEKLQVYKLKYRNPLMLQCTDKYTVREYVKNRGLSDILIPLIGIYNNVDEINFELLPREFVIKTTDGGGGNQVLICKDKENLSKIDTFSKIEKWLSQPICKKHVGREWAYDNGQPRRILIEKFISPDINEEIIDYKFFCFDGEVQFIYGVSDRKVGKSAKLGIYDKDFNKLNISRKDEIPQEMPLERPKNFEEMVRIANILSVGFPEVRVDLYNINGVIYFGELTFYDGSGYMSFEPDSFDFKAGNFFDINKFL